MKEFYTRTNLYDLFANEHELSDLIRDNPDTVAQWIGEDDPVTFRAREERFADVRADITFTTADGKLVEVEVQRGDADDQHLGEIVRHISQIQADYVVWVSQEFNREMNRVIRQWNDESNSREYFTVEIHGVEGTDLLGWTVVECPYTLDKAVKQAREIPPHSKS